MADRIANTDQDFEQESTDPLPLPSGSDSMSTRHWHSLHSKPRTACRDGPNCNVTQERNPNLSEDSPRSDPYTGDCRVPQLHPVATGSLMLDVAASPINLVGEGTFHASLGGESR